MTGSPTTHTLSVLVEDKPGVLARVASLFSRRGFNIESLAVGATEQKDMSRMTIVVSVEETPLEQITKQLNKLINVIKIVEQDDDNSVSRELALIKVRADAGTRSQVIEAVNLFRAKVVDVSPESLTIEATGRPRQARSAAAGAGAVRHPRNRPVRSGVAVPRSARHRHRQVTQISQEEDREGCHSGIRDVLRRRRRPVDHPGPQGRRHRLRQPGPRALVEPARLRRPGARRAQGGLEVPGQGRPSRAWTSTPPPRSPSGPT